MNPTLTEVYGSGDSASTSAELVWMATQFGYSKEEDKTEDLQNQRMY